MAEQIQNKKKIEFDSLAGYHSALIISVTSLIMSIATVLYKNQIDMTTPFFIASIALVPIILKVEKLENYSLTWIGEFKFKQRLIIYIFAILIYYIIIKTQFLGIKNPAPFNINADFKGILLQIFIYLLITFMISVIYTIQSTIIYGIGIAFIAYFAPKIAKRIIKKENRDSE
ncbi:hypothetical protein BG261_10760 [Floricoccus tropicus]|uniref:Uncharacterized protein n=1 Tax=Floricoccus tropicus TaxID=1859473 RepID=A0A1E8GNB9_9LACT|nr:hypothetical protein [Floricoccus tropicus]OFI49751.1 hypothetical protein BG261_10760 [Floricoccus tropicus]